jgi:hypothetical protein
MAASSTVVGHIAPSSVWMADASEAASIGREKSFLAVRPEQLIRPHVFIAETSSPGKAVAVDAFPWEKRI